MQQGIAAVANVAVAVANSHRRPIATKLLSFIMSGGVN